MTATVASLRAELRHDSRQVARATPRLTWTIDTEERDWRQASYELRCGDDVVGAESRESVLVDWPFAPLASGEVREVSVRVTAESGTVTEWSTPVPVEAAFLGEGEWRALPIGLAAPDRPAQPALVRRKFTIDKPVRRATLFSTALGSVEARLNGELVDDGVLSPGWTSYHERLVHETTDVTSLLEVGPNVLGLALAGAWYTEEYGFHSFVRRVYGEQPRALAQLRVEFEDGTTETIITDDSWRATASGPLVSSGIYEGEHYDATRELGGWDTVEFDDASWTAALVDDIHTPVPEARVAEPVRRLEELPVHRAFLSPSGAQLLDFGQNLVGRLRIRVEGPRGTVITLRHAEVLENGELALVPLRRAAATDVYVLSGNGVETWEPTFTFHGFQYAQIDGWPGEFDPSAVSAVVIHSDMRRTGWFSSSHAMLDRLHDNVLWGMRGNFFSIPTDCPQRDERLGWTGDIEVFAPTASFLYDCDGFLVSWLRDLAIEQSSQGGIVPLVVPAVLPTLASGPTAAWGDAATIVPWVLYERFGDRGVLADQYPSMRAWVEALLAQSGDTGLWAGTFQLGDWLDPTAPPDKPHQARTDSDIVASAYLVKSLRIAAKTAALLGETADAERYELAAERCRAAFVAEYVTPAGRMMSDGQTAYALALGFDLVTEPEARANLAARLANLVRANGYRIGTGFVGTPLVAPALSDAGHLDAASRLLLQTENPSWLYPVTMGATTVWERWDSLLDDGSVNPGEMTSFNHYALGAVADWMHRTVAGLGPDAPGYSRLRIAPRPLRQLEHAEARHETPYGTASVSWFREGSVIVVKAEVPANTTAIIDLPGRPESEVGSGTHEWSFEQIEAAASTVPLGLDSSTAAIIDNDAAYRAVLDAIASHDPALATSFRTETVWAEGRSVRESLLFTPPHILESIQAALADVTGVAHVS